MKIVIVATHLESLQAAVETLTREGFLLSQIDVCFHPAAHSADVQMDFSGDRIRVEWHMEAESAERDCRTTGPVTNLGETFRELVEK